MRHDANCIHYSLTPCYPMPEPIPKRCALSMNILDSHKKTGSEEPVTEDDEQPERQVHRLARFSIRSSTTLGSARVLVSPRPSVSLAAILRRMRRMILPERVLGSPGDH